MIGPNEYLAGLPREKEIDIIVEMELKKILLNGIPNECSKQMYV